MSVSECSVNRVGPREPPADLYWSVRKPNGRYRRDDPGRLGERVLAQDRGAFGNSGSPGLFRGVMIRVTDSPLLINCYDRGPDCLGGGSAVWGHKIWSPVIVLGASGLAARWSLSY